jgi:hypothetical protein
VKKPKAKPQPAGTEKRPEAAPKTGGRSALDRLFFRIVTFGWGSERVSDYIAQVTRYEASLPNNANEAFRLIDAKATGLLQHVSLMIAGLGLVAPLVADSRLELGVIVAEIAVYLLLSIGCLRCLAIFNSRDLRSDGSNRDEVIRHEMIIRHELYALCNRAAILFTILVFAILPLMFLYRPGHAP